MQKSKISAGAEKTYRGALAIMKMHGIDLDCVDLDCVFKLFDDKQYSLSTQNVYLSALVWYSTHNDVNKMIIKKVSKLIVKNMILLKNKDGEHVMTQIEENKYVSWNTVKNVLFYLFKMIDTDKKYMKKHAMLALYVYHPPRRIKDYSLLVLNDNIDIKQDNTTILWNNSDTKGTNVFDNINARKFVSNDENNYYARKNDRAFFIFNNYKTARFFKQQVIEVDSELKKILDEYLAIHKISQNQKIFETTSEAFKAQLCDIFKKLTGKKISASMLRHIYITYCMNVTPKLTYNEKNRISTMMAHSYEAQSLYEKFIDEKQYDVDVAEYYERWLMNFNNKKNKKSATIPKNKYETELERKQAKLLSQKKWRDKQKNKNNI